MAFFNVMISGFGRIAQHIGNIRTGFESQHSRKFCTMAFREQTSKRNSCSNDDGFQTLRNLHDKCNHEFIYQYSILSINRVQEVFIIFFSKICFQVEQTFTKMDSILASHPVDPDLIQGLAFPPLMMLRQVFSTAHTAQSVSGQW